LSVSFLEALAWETPLIACVDPEGIVSRFGTFVGNYPGTGIEGLPAFAAAVKELLANAERRSRLGAEGRTWVTDTHNRTQFLKALSRLCTLAGVNAPTISELYSAQTRLST
jgi:hypothetical protein